MTVTTCPVNSKHQIQLQIVEVTSPRQGRSTVSQFSFVHTDIQSICICIIKECKLGRLGRIGFVFRILQQQPEYEERRSSCAEQESSLSSLAATRQHVFLPPSALLSRHFSFFIFQWHQQKWLTPWMLTSDCKWEVKYFQEGDQITIFDGQHYNDANVSVVQPHVVFNDPLFEDPTLPSD